MIISNISSIKWSRLWLPVLSLIFLLPLPSSGTDGYFSNGVGIRYRSMAGAGVALYLSPMSAGINPAAMVLFGKGIDINVSLFNPNRNFTIEGNPSQQPGTFGLAPGQVESSSTVFLIPSFGANWMIKENMSFGLNIFAQGGMNTNYESPVFGSDPTGVDLAQVFISPTLSFKLGENHSFGVSPILAYQRFKANGAAAFSALSSNPASLSDNGHNSSFGLGARIGYLGRLNDNFSIGLSFQTKMYMSEFEDYSGLFAEQGDFDIPMNFTAGIAYSVNRLQLAVDVKHIFYSDITSIGNPLLPNLRNNPLGTDGGAGFGWRDMTVVKIGVSYELSDKLIARAGYSYGRQPIPESEVLFNILAPGVIESHISAGISTEVGSKKELSIFITRALSNSVTGANPLEVPDGQTITLEMDQWEFGIGITF